MAETVELYMHFRLCPSPRRCTCQTAHVPPGLPYRHKTCFVLGIHLLLLLCFPSTLISAPACGTNGTAAETKSLVGSSVRSGRLSTLRCRLSQQPEYETMTATFHTTSSTGCHTIPSFDFLSRAAAYSLRRLEDTLTLGPTALLRGLVL